MNSGLLRIHVFGITLGAGLLFAAGAFVMSFELGQPSRGSFTPQQFASSSSLMRKQNLFPDLEISK